MLDRPKLPPISEQIWDMKYRLKDAAGEPADRDIDATFARVARAVAQAEPEPVRAELRERFAALLREGTFLPAGRILAGAGANRSVTLFNCFVMGRIEDDMSSIFENLKEAALTMQQGGGIGHDFSTLRPKGALVRGVGAEASGPVSFMDIWDTMCRSIMSAGMRRGAMMATLRCDHPDIEEFVAAKSDPARLRNFNLSVLVTDDFMASVRADAPWSLVFGGQVYRTVAARDLWNRILRATYDYAEPGVIFIDRVNALNNLLYTENISATNPCGEQPLPPHGACLLGSINLARLVIDPFTDDASLDEARLAESAGIATRFLDDVIDVSRYPLPEQATEARNKRRIGLGVTGLADALVMLGARYGSDRAAELAGRWMEIIKRASYAASAALAREKEPFPLFEAEAYLASPNLAWLDDALRAEIAEHGIRNALLTSVAPTGTISLFAGNVSSGVEPIFDLSFRRRILERDGNTREEIVEDESYRAFRDLFGPDAPLTDAFVTVGDLVPEDHLRMQAALQRHVDSAISKTVNCPAEIGFEAFRSLYDRAYDLRLKGCTTYRPNAVTGAVLSAGADTGTQPALPLEAPAVLDAPHPREPALAGFTYKLRWPDSDHAIYVTINDAVIDGRRAPFEIFINSKNLEHYAWTVALTRMISAVFRRGGDVSFVVDELRAVFDPRGGRWMDGRYLPSLLAAIGDIIGKHMVAIGALSPEAAARALPSTEACPRCGQGPLVHQEGCLICRDCGYSRCS